MEKLLWLALALASCANTGGPPESARRPLPVATPIARAVASAAPSSEPSPAAAPSATALVIVAGGDVSFGREVGQRVQHEADYSPLGAIQHVWREADVRFVNLESQLSFQNGETQSPRHRLIFTGPPEGALSLSRAGVTLVSTANNHAWDYGRSALLETLEHLRKANVLYTGTGRDLEEARRPVRLEIKGVRIAWFAVTHVWNQGPIEAHEGRAYVAWANLEAMKSALASARRESDLVVLSYHGGAEYQDAPSDVTRRFVDAAVEAGVDVVFGHHPHVIQGIGFTRERPVFFSLGNLVFGPRWEHPWTRYGMLAKLSVSPDGARTYSVCPYRIDDFAPVPLDRPRDAQSRARFLSHVKSASTAVGGVRFGETDAAGCTAVLPAQPTRSPVDPPRADPKSQTLARR